MSDIIPEKYPWTDKENYRYKGSRKLDDIYRSRWGENVKRLYVKNSRWEDTVIGNAIVCEEPFSKKTPINATVYLGKIFVPHSTLYQFDFYSLNKMGFDSVYYRGKFYVYTVEQVYMDNYDPTSKTSSKEEKKEDIDKDSNTEIETLRKEVKDMEEKFEKMKEQFEQKTQCIVCMDETLSHLSLKCRHLCMCTNCAHKLDQCPMCREPFQKTDLFRVYLPN